jgi:hypothetical protein
MDSGVQPGRTWSEVIPSPGDLDATPDDLSQRRPWTRSFSGDPPAVVAAVPDQKCRPLRHISNEVNRSVSPFE